VTKETVRYPDEVVDAVEEVVGDGVFESKSEFYRFSAEYVLRAIDPDYDPETIDFEEIESELHDYGAGAEPAGEFFADAVRVRKLGLRGEFDAAESVIDSYADTSGEAVLLEGLLGRFR
jgi:Arc/MetJ-type ribon-helix-helix transcriptional regulator